MSVCELWNFATCDVSSSGDHVPLQCTGGQGALDVKCTHPGPEVAVCTYNNKHRSMQIRIPEDEAESFVIWFLNCARLQGSNRPNWS
jgi:hypothetical protein